MTGMVWTARRVSSGMWAVAKKDMRLYYVKGPVVIFGLLFPLFLFLAFSLGRNLTGDMFAAPMLVMAVFFTSSSVGPIIAPWETRMRTLEKLMTAPIPVASIILGGVLAGFAFGIAISSIALISAVVLLGVTISQPALLAVSMVVACFGFSSFGIFLSYPPTDNPSNVMMLANLVKLPLIFVSGVFIPLSDMSRLGGTLAFLSPLTYFSELARSSLGFSPVASDLINILALSGFAVVFLILAIVMHGRNMWKRF